MLKAGSGFVRRPGIDKFVAVPWGSAVARDQDRMKKIAVIAFLLAICGVAGRAQESRQDISLSGTALIEPFVASSTLVQVHSTTAYGALLSYRFMLTPTIALEANYGITYQNKINFSAPPNKYDVLVRNQEISGALVKSFVYKNWNPFVELGPGAFVFSPIINTGTQTLDVKRQIQIGGIFGAGIAYQISPSFDIRAEYRGWVTKVPTFDNPAFATNKWYPFNVYNPVVGVAYHF
jgi:outer membrane immunogenic protein